MCESFGSIPSSTLTASHREGVLAPIVGLPMTSCQIVDTSLAATWFPVVWSVRLVSARCRRPVAPLH